MLANAFKRASEGTKCLKCGALVNLSFVKRHDRECKGVKKPSAIVDDDGIEVIRENIMAANGETSTSKMKKTNEKRPLTPVSAPKRPESTDEIVLLSDSDGDVEPLPKRKSLDHSTVPSTSKASNASKMLVRTARANVYANDPSANMNLTEVYEKLMEQLQLLCDAGRSGGNLIATQTNVLLTQSQSPKKKPLFNESQIPQETIPSSSKPSTSNTPFMKVPFSGIGFAGGTLNHPRPKREEREQAELAEKEAEKMKPELEDDLAENKILEANPKYGSSYIVRFFWMMLKRVLSKEAGIQGENATDFWGDDLRLFYWLVTMGDLEQYLFIRLCLRLRKWLTVEELQKYATNETNIVDIASGLVAAGLIEESDAPTSSITLEEALSKLSRAELTRLARTYKVEHRLKVKDVCTNLLSIASGKCVFGQSMYPRVLSNAKKHLGNGYRVKQHPLNLFNSILTLYCPNHMDSTLLFDPAGSQSGLASNLMFQLLQVETGKLEFCGPQDLVRCISIYQTSQELRNYMEAKRIETEMAFEKRSGNYQRMFDSGMIAVTTVKDMVENQKEVLKHLAAFPHYLRRYTEFWVLIRCSMHTIDSMERLRRYQDAVDLLEYLLKTEDILPFFLDRRGFLYDRLALDLQAHLKLKEESLDACIRGIMDPIVRDKDRLLLQDRALRISKDFEVILKIQEPEKIFISGKIIDKYLGETRINHFYVEVGGEKEIVSVEELALRHFRKEQNFYGGMHSEGGIWHTIFGVICYDIIFDHDVEGVWFSPIQEAPADMNTLDFFERRKERFEERLSLLLEEDRTQVLEDIMRNNFEMNRGRTNAQIDWNVFMEFGELMSFMSCLRREQLAMIIKRIAEDHRHHRSGFPDLTLWDPLTKRLAVIEVKGPGDKLSTKQRLWLDFFTKHGVEAYVCHVTASKNRQLPKSTKKTSKQQPTKEESENGETEMDVEEINLVEEDEEEFDDFMVASKAASTTTFTSSRVTRSNKNHRLSSDLDDDLSFTG